MSASVGRQMFGLSSLSGFWLNETNPNEPNQPDSRTNQINQMIQTDYTRKGQPARPGLLLYVGPRAALSVRTKLAGRAKKQDALNSLLV